MKLSTRSNKCGIFIVIFFALATIANSAQACSCGKKKKPEQKNAEKPKVIKVAQNKALLKKKIIDLTPKKDSIQPQEIQQEIAETLTRAEGDRKINFRHNVYVDGDVVVNTPNTLYASTLATNSGTSTAVANDLAMNPCRKLLTNTIGPVMTDATSTEPGKNSIDPQGSTYFTGHVGLAPTNTFFANEIAPVRNEITACSNKGLITTATHNMGGTTSFSGNVAIRPTPSQGDDDDGVVNTFLTNRVAPVMIDEDGVCQENSNGNTLFVGNVSIDEGKSLEINGALHVHGKAYMADVLNMGPTTPILTNNISPMQPDNVGDYTIDPQGTINLNGNLAIQEALYVATIGSSNDTVTIANNAVIESSKSLTVNLIQSAESDTHDTPLTLNSTIKLRNARTMGQTPTLHLIAEQATPSLGITFAPISSNQISQLGTQGAMVTITLQGIGFGHDHQGITINFDFFANLTVFVGPGSTFQNVVCSGPQLYYGHNSPYQLQTLETSFSPISNTSVVINLTPRHEPTAQFTLDWVDAIIAYDIMGTNVISTDLPS